MLKFLVIPSVLFGLSACSYTQHQVERVEGLGAKVEGSKVILHCKRNLGDRTNYERLVNDYILENEPDGKTIYLRPICPGD